MNTNKTLRKLGFSIWVVGLGLTFMNPDIFGLIVWFTGLCIYFIFNVDEEKEIAKMVQESQ